MDWGDGLVDVYGLSVSACGITSELNETLKPRNVVAAEHISIMESRSVGRS
jgi:hypothetical protein